MWCIYMIDTATHKGYLFHDYPEFDGAEVIDNGQKFIIPKRDGSLKEGARVLYRTKKMIAHNILGYDLFVLNKFFPQFKLDKALPKCWDTLVQSKCQRFDREPRKGFKGIHGLDVWGARLGYRKPPVLDWSTIDAFKLHRCIEDVKINLATYQYLEKEREKALDSRGIDFMEGLINDHAYRFNATLQELRGAPFDVPYARGCVDQLDGFIEDLRQELEPKLPPTLKIKSQKCTWEEVGKALKWKKWPTTQYEYRERNGVAKEYQIKPTAKPTTKLVVATGNYGKAVAEWFDIDPKRAKTDKPVAGPYCKIEYSPSKMSQHEVVKDYLLKECGWKPTEYNYKKEKDGSYARDARGRLIETSPKLTEDSYDSIKGSIGESIAKYNTYSHRRRFLENDKDDEKGLLNMVRDNGRIPCGLNVFGTATGRSSQYVWVNAPSVGTLFGEEVRTTIRAPKGRVLIGADMKSAQLSIAAYYAKNYDYYMAVADGQEEIDDPDNIGKKIYLGESGHCVNARAFGLVSDEEWKRAIETQDKELLHHISLQRKLSKGGSFATIFGATGKKVATTLGIPEQQGVEAREKFLAEIGLDDPIERLDRMTKKYKYGQGGYIELPFGYWVWCKSKHKQFNYLDQGTEAACQKVAVNYFEKHVKTRGLDAFKILDVHDEFLVESNPACQQEVGALMCESYKYASDKCFEWHKEHSQWFSDLEFPFNLDGGFKVGETYCDVH